VRIILTCCQFTFTVINCPYYAHLVRTFDVSNFFNERDSEGRPVEMAGWREFKYRHHNMFAVPRRPSSPSPQAYTSLEEQKALNLPLSYSSRTHPAPSPLLDSFHRCRDIPIGGICHVIMACWRIRHLNLSKLQLASDFVVQSPSISRPSSKQVTSPNFYVCEPEQSKATITFVSDVPKSWTWTYSELIPIYTDQILGLICQMTELESITAQHAVWLSTRRVKRLMKDARRNGPGMKGLTKLDFRNSGLHKGLGWAIEASRDEIEEIVNAMPEVYERRIS
jgi:hypothetical protein